MQFDLTRYLYSCYRNPDVSNSRLLREGNEQHEWSKKKIAMMGCGALLELTPCMLVAAAVFLAVFAGISRSPISSSSMIKLTCLALATQYIGSRVNVLMMKYLHAFSDIKLKSDEELVAYIDHTPKSLLPYAPVYWAHSRDLCLMELVKRNLDRRDAQGALLFEATSMPLEIVAMIQAYATTFQQVACERIIQVGYVQGLYRDRVLKDQLLNRCVGKFQDLDCANIEQQVHLITQLSQRTDQIAYLQRLVQFHHAKRNVGEVQEILKNCFKFMFALPLDPIGRTYPMTHEGDLYSLCAIEIADQLRNRPDPELNRIVIILTSATAFTDLFCNHYIVGKNLSQLAGVLDKLLVAWSSDEKRRRFQDELSKTLFPEHHAS